MTKKQKPVISYATVVLMIMALVLTRLNVKNLVSFALPESQDFVVGDQVVATWCEGTLTLHGEGATYDYSKDSLSPFYELRNQTSQVVIENGITGIGAYLFYDFGHLTGTLTIPGSVVSIGDCAFSGSSKETAPHYTLIDNQFVTHDVMVDILESRRVSNSFFFSQLNEMGKNEESIETEYAPDSSELNKDQENSIDENQQNHGMDQNDLESNDSEANGVVNGENIREDEETFYAESKEDVVSDESGAGNTENEGKDAPETNDDETEKNETEDSETEENETEDSETEVIDETEDENLEETDENFANDTVSGNNVSKEYRTISAQVIGSNIFYEGQVGGYMIADESNTTFAEAMEASGYGRYLGSRMITIKDAFGQSFDISVINTAKGVIMPTLLESGLSLPVNTAYVSYHFSCWESVSGVYYLPGSYSNEAEFQMYLIREYAEPEQMELSCALDEFTILAVRGKFPIGTSLCLKDFSASYENGSRYIYEPYFMIDEQVYEPSSEAIERYTIKSELLDDTHEVSLKRIVGESKQDIPWQVVDQTETYQICYAACESEKMELRIWEKEILPESVECYLTLSGISFLQDVINGADIKEQDEEHILLFVPYGEKYQIPLCFSENYNWPLNVHAFRDSNLLFAQSFEKEDVLQLMEKDSIEETHLLAEEDILFYILSKELLQDDIELHISATLKNQELSKLEVGTCNQPIYDWVEVGESSFATISGVNEIEGFTISYESSNGLPDSKIKMRLLQGYLPENTEFFLQYQLNEEVKTLHMTLSENTKEIDMYSLFGELDLHEVYHFQLIFDFMGAEPYGKNENLYISIEDETHQLIADNGVSVEIIPVCLQAMDLYVETGNGVAKKDAMVYEGTRLTVHGLKQAHSADLYPYEVVAFYTDPECMIPAILPEKINVSADGQIINNYVYFENKTGANLSVSLDNLAGENGLTPGEDYYIRAYVVKECPDPFVIMKKYMITSDVVSIAIQNKPEYELIVNGLEEGCVLSPGEGLSACQILYEVRNLGEGQKLQVKAVLSCVNSSGDEITFQEMKANIISKDYQFVSRLGMSAGSFERVKLILPADLTSGMYRIRFVLTNLENGNELADYMYYFVVNE